MPTPFEVAALQGAIDIIEAVRVRLDVQGMRRFGMGAYTAIAEYEVAEAVRLMQRLERRKIRRKLMQKLALARRKKRGVDGKA